MKTNLTAARTRFAGLFQDREFVVRSGDQVKFFRLSARTQKRAAAASGALLAALVGTTGYFSVQSALSEQARLETAARAQNVAKAEREVATYQANVGHVASDLEARQLYLEELTRAYMPESDEADAPRLKPRSQAGARGSALTPAQEIAKLEALRLRQDAFADDLRAFADARAARADSVIRRLGLNPQQLASLPQAAMGGPLERVPSLDLASRVKDSRFTALSDAFRRMARLEQALTALPGARPAAGILSSNFGYRSDPFTGEGAFHAGLDFPGPIGSPIFASAAGKVSFVGEKQGYGHVVEVDHGGGIMTRYAHLSGFNTQLGESVTAGQQIARMGSSGRSTGSHLHFEVRLNGAPLNPRRFLEGSADVFEIKNAVRERIARAADDA